MPQFPNSLHITPPRYGHGAFEVGATVIFGSTAALAHDIAKSPWMCGFDKEGHSVPYPPAESAKRACDMAEALMAEFIARDWLNVVPAPTVKAKGDE